MRLPNLSGSICESNPLYSVIDLADSSSASAGILHAYVRAIAIDLMGDEHIERRNVIAFAVLYAALGSIIPAFAAFTRADCEEQVRIDGVLDFIWAYGLDAHAYACDAIGNHAERREPVAYAYLVAGFYRAMVEQMRAEMSGSGKVFQ
jgi:hypothetical protein